MPEPMPWRLHIAIGCLVILALPPLLFALLMLILVDSGITWERQIGGGNLDLLFVLSLPALGAAVVVALLRRRRDSSLRFVVSDPPEVVLQHLERFAREWRDTELPDALRAGEYTISEVFRRGEQLMVTLEPTGHGPAYVLQAYLAANDGGSLLRGRVQEARRSKLAIACFLTAAALFLAWILFSDDGLNAATLLPAVALTAFLIGLRVLTVRPGQKSVVPLFQDLIEHALRTSRVG